MDKNKEIEPEGDTIIEIPGEGMESGYFEVVNMGNGLEEKGDNYSVSKKGNKEIMTVLDIISEIRIKIDQLKDFYHDNARLKNYDEESRYLEVFIDLAKKPTSFFLGEENKRIISKTISNPKIFLDLFESRLDDNEKRVINIIKKCREFSYHEGILRPDVVRAISNGQTREYLSIEGVKLFEFYVESIKILEKFYKEISAL